MRYDFLAWGPFPKALSTIIFIWLRLYPDFQLWQGFCLWILVPLILFPELVALWSSVSIDTVFRDCVLYVLARDSFWCHKTRCLNELIDFNWCALLIGWFQSFFIWDNGCSASGRPFWISSCIEIWRFSMNYGAFFPINTELWNSVFWNTTPSSVHIILVTISDE